MRLNPKKTAKLAGCQSNEQFLLTLAYHFISLNPDEIDKTITSTLAQLAEYVDADRCYIYLITNNETVLKLTHHYYQEGVKSKIRQHEQVDKEDFQWLMDTILNCNPVNISKPSDIESKASTIGMIMNVESTNSMLLWPLCNHDKVIGFIGLDSVKEPKKFTAEHEYLVEKSAELIALAFDRRIQAHREMLLEKKYKNLFSKIEDVVFISTPEGKFLEINNAGVKLLGYNSIEEVLNLNIEKDLYFNPKKRSEYQKLMKIHGHIKNYEITLKRKDANKVIVMETATVVRNDEGTIVAYQGIWHDITETRQLEQQLAQSQKIESIGQLAGGVAHDFNNILTAIRGYAELIRLRMEESDQNYKGVQNIIEGSNRAGKLIKNLLAFSRQQMIEPKIININTVISDLHSMLSRLIRQDINLKLNLSKDLHNIQADPTQIQQVIVNLVVNANHAIKMDKSRSKQKSIQIFTDETNLTDEHDDGQSLNQNGKYILMAVEDTGIGIEKSIQNKIFEPFYSTKKEGEGSGLGLSTVYGIVKQNNGVIRIESEPGVGSIFEIYWPVTMEEQLNKASIESKIQIRKTNETILVVEDDPGVREWISEALQSLGYKVFEAEDGEKALDMAVNDNLIDKIDLLISDIVMPSMNGEELAENIKAIKPSIKIILCSGYSQSRVSFGEKTAQYKYPFLTKPFTIKELEKTIRSVLQQSNQVV